MSHDDMTEAHWNDRITCRLVQRMVDLDVGSAKYEISGSIAWGSSSISVACPTLSRSCLKPLRHEDGSAVTTADVEALATWDAAAEPVTEIAFTPSRVLLQDFTGVPAVVDLAAMRDAMRALGGDPGRSIRSPGRARHRSLGAGRSVRSARRLARNTEIEFNRNRERYAFLRWGQKAFRDFRVVPPGTGIVHQINLEYLARVVFAREHDGVTRAYPDTVVGTDSHTTMVNGLGVLGWGVGGIEAEAAMLGQPISMLIPQVVGFELTGRLPEGATATDLVLTVVRDAPAAGRRRQVRGVLRRRPRPSAARRSHHHRKHGSGVRRDLRHLPRGRGESRVSSSFRARGVPVALVEAYARAQGLFREPGTPPPTTPTLSRST